MSAPAFAAISTAFSGATATAGATAAAGAAATGAVATGAATTGAVATGAAAATGGGLLAGLGSNALVGGLVSGLGIGLVERQQAKDEQEALEAERKRRERSYEGIGEATRFWERRSDGASGNNQTTANTVAEKFHGNRSGAGSGAQFRNVKTGDGRSFKYDRDKGKIVKE